MSVVKIVIITTIIAVVLLASLLYLALAPTVKDVSERWELKPLLNKPLTLSRSGVLYYCHEADYNFRQHVLTEYDDYPCQKKYDVPSGSLLTINQFKTYKNATSGFTDLYALAVVELPSGEKVEVEYNWGSTDLAQLAKQSPELPRAIWQEPHEQPVLFSVQQP